MVLLCVVCIWHAIAILFTTNARYIDRVALGVLLSCYVVFNIIFAIRSRYKVYFHIILNQIHALPEET